MLAIKSVFSLLIGAMLLLAPVSCRQVSVNDPVAPVPTRTLVSSSLIGEFTTAQLRSRFTGANAPLQFFIRYGIKAYRLDYTTINTDGKPVRASGALIIPGYGNIGAAA